MDDTTDETPEAILDRIRDSPGVAAGLREEWIGTLVERYPPERLIEAARARLGALGGEDAEAVLRLVEAFGDETLYRELAEALIGQPDLPAERSWAALGLVDQTGLLDDYPVLKERWEDLGEAIEGDTSLEDLAAQLEGDADGLWVALQGLGAVEPEVRAEIIAGLADGPGGPGLVAFLRLLTFAHDPATRWAALDALDDRPDDPDVRAAWRAIAEAHPDAGVVGRALARVGEPGEVVVTTGSGPEVVRSLVTAVDGEGKATIALTSREGERWTGAAFLCHGLRGVVDVVGQQGPGDGGLDESFAVLGEPTRGDLLRDVPELALRLLAGSLTLCGPSTSPALRYWVERTAGPTFRAVPGLDLFGFGDWNPATLPFAEMPDRARAVVRAVPTWTDSSELAADLAREVTLRGGGGPDPRRDAGAYRYLFEHRLASRIDLYQRMLLWMAAFWKAKGEDDLGRSALALAWQIADPQHAVPGHPFFVELTTMSLEAARPS